MLFSDRMRGVGPLYTVRKWQAFSSFCCFACVDRTLSSWCGWPALEGLGPSDQHHNLLLGHSQAQPWASHQLPLSTWETNKKLLLTCKMHSVTKGTSRWEFQLKTITFTLWWINNTPGHRREVPPHWGSTGHDPRLLSCSKVRQSGTVRHHIRLWKSSSSCVTWNVSPHQVFQSRENGKLLLVLEKEISFDEP